MKQDRRRKDTKLRIIQTAIRLFSEKGFDGVSIRDIAKNTGITAASFYNHFRSKDELLAGMFAYYGEKIIDPVVARFEPEKMMEELGAVKFIEKFLELMFQTEHDEELFLISRILAMEQNKNRTAAEIVYTSRQQNLKLLTELIVTMEKKGLINTGAPEMMARFMGYMMIGISTDYFYLRYIQNQAPEEIMKRQQALAVSFCRAILNPVPSGKGETNIQED